MNEYFAETSPLLPEMSRPSQEKTTPRSSGSYQRIKNGNKGLAIEDHHDTAIPIEDEVHPKDVKLEIHDDALPTKQNKPENEDPLSDMDVEEGSLKAITKPNIRDKDISTPQYKNIW
eukprot:CAMPEP_0168574386 /NCGR_PEP_ID=MMETSP0413-20121227/19049_1 /TAXON_ID=136452 /ORGANISM="Filamoeba nolandi, Strain NC-AS-23-1" /LENGTH=116 /DNA_ID=CAMNT_0008607717 /DNA_START=1 /DNA_END=349 /DNA_ORIENTATION=-